MKKVFILIPLDIRLEREELYGRLKRYIEVCERILENPNIDYEAKLKAATVLAQLTARAGKIITEMQLDEIQEQLLKLEKKMKRKR